MPSRAALVMKRLSFWIFTAVNIYWWIFIPLVRLALDLIAGRNVADSVAIRLVTFCPISVLAGPRVVFCGFGDAFLYYAGLLFEMLSFSAAFLIVTYDLRRPKSLLMRFVNYTVVACLVVLLARLIREDWFGCILPCFASVLGMVLALWERRRSGLKVH